MALNNEGKRICAKCRKFHSRDKMYKSHRQYKGLLCEDCYRELHPDSKLFSSVVRKDEMPKVRKRNTNMRKG